MVDLVKPLPVIETVPASQIVFGQPPPGQGSITLLRSLPEMVTLPVAGDARMGWLFSVPVMVSHPVAGAPAKGTVSVSVLNHARLLYVRASVTLLPSVAFAEPTGA